MTSFGKPIIPAIAAIVLLVLAGCVSLPRERIEINRYWLAPPQADSSRTQWNAKLHVTPFAASSPLQGDRILYSEGEGRMDPYFYHRWVSPPQSMVDHALVEYLRTGGFFGGGVHYNRLDSTPGYVLNGSLSKLYFVDEKRDARAVMEVTITLKEVAEPVLHESVVFQETYNVQASVASRTVEAFVRAANGALGTLCERIGEDVQRSILERSSPEPPGNAR